MAWRSISITEVRLTPAEKAALQAIQGADTIGAAILLKVIRRWVGRMKGAGYSVAENDTAPDAVNIEICNQARWLWLCEFPQLKTMQTKEREKLHDDAEAVLAKIDAQDLNIESPVASSVASAAAGSFTRLPGRIL